MAKLVSGSVRPGTSRLYDVKWKAFCVWCDEHRIVASEVSTSVVADFLTIRYHTQSFILAGVSVNSMH